MREAFLEALYAAVRVSPQSNVVVERSTNRAAELLMACQAENAASRSLSNNIVYLQAIILMSLCTELSGPAYTQAQQAMPGAAWLGMAVGLAYFLKLHVNRSYTNLGGGDPDSSEKLCRRTWWTLVTLDRWHASSTSSPLLIPDTSTVLLPEDRAVLGDSAYHLARAYHMPPPSTTTPNTNSLPGLSLVLGHISEIQLADPSPFDFPKSHHGSLVSHLLTGELDRFRESVDTVLHSHPIVHLSYWHVKALVRCYTQTSISSTDELLDAVTVTTNILNSKINPPSPLTHHFVALAVLVLVQLAGVKETRENALRGLHDLADALEKGRILAPATRGDGPAGWDSVIMERISKRLQQAQHAQQQQSGPSDATAIDRGGLQHLADLAVGESEGQGAGQTAAANGEKSGQEKEKSAGEGGAEGVNWAVLMRSGYLNGLA